MIIEHDYWVRKLELHTLDCYGDLYSMEISGVITNGREVRSFSDSCKKCFYPTHG